MDNKYVKRWLGVRNQMLFLIVIVLPVRGWAVPQSLGVKIEDYSDYEPIIDKEYTITGRLTLHIFV